MSGRDHKMKKILLSIISLPDKQLEIISETWNLFPIYTLHWLWYNTVKDPVDLESFSGSIKDSLSFRLSCFLVFNLRVVNFEIFYRNTDLVWLKFDKTGSDRTTLLI